MLHIAITYITIPNMFLLILYIHYHTACAYDTETEKKINIIH